MSRGLRFAEGGIGMLSRFRQTRLPFLGLAMSIACAVVGQGDERKNKPNALPSQWRMVNDIPNFEGGGETRGDKVTIWVEDGWVVARRQTSSGDLEWHIVLARASNPQPPEVKVDQVSGGLSITYGAYFLREDCGRLRVLRQRKNNQSPAWSMPAVNAKRELLAAAGGTTSLEVIDNWCWGTSGPSETKPDVRIRMQHAQLGDGQGGQAWRGGLARVFFGSSSLQDEGDLLVATRVLIPAAEAELRLRKARKEITEKLAPPLDGKEWLNTERLSLDKLRGKVVLLDFWGQWCGPCVKKLPTTEELHVKFKERGLVVIGVHSADQSDNVADFLKSKKASFPVMVDRGETAKRYLIESWPTYFLIDKTGRVVWGFAHDPPTPVQIEELLGK
jgi:thiol-disulfide isomerase/thioredoxin